MEAFHWAMKIARGGSVLVHKFSSELSATLVWNLLSGNLVQSQKTFFCKTDIRFYNYPHGTNSFPPPRLVQ